MIKALVKKLYFKLFPDRADVSKEYVIGLESEQRDYKHWEASLNSKHILRKPIRLSAL